MRTIQEGASRLGLAIGWTLAAGAVACSGAGDATDVGEGAPVTVAEEEETAASALPEEEEARLTEADFAAMAEE